MLLDARPSQGTFLNGLWDLGDLAAGASADLEIDVLVAAAGVYVNTAEVTAANEPDRDSTPGNDDPAEDDQDDAVLIAEQADLSVTKDVDDAAPELGDQVTFTITVANDGPSAATGVEVTDALPAGLTLVATLASQGSYDPISGVWTVGTIAAGDAAALRVTVEVVGFDPIANVAEVTGSEQPDPDSTPGNSAPTEDDLDEATVVPQVASLEGTLWVDMDRDGVIDAEESLLAGIPVALLDANGNVVATAITDGNGQYFFEGLEPGVYTVAVDLTALPAGLDTRTFDPDGDLDARFEVTLEGGANVADIDFGFAPQVGPTGVGGGGGILPTTGLHTSQLAMMALLLLVVGAAFVVGARKQRPAPRDDPPSE